MNKNEFILLIYFVLNLHLPHKHNNIILQLYIFNKELLYIKKK